MTVLELADATEQMGHVGIPHRAAWCLKAAALRLAEAVVLTDAAAEAESAALGKCGLAIDEAANRLADTASRAFAAAYAARVAATDAYEAARKEWTDAQEKPDADADA